MVFLDQFPVNLQLMSLLVLAEVKTTVHEWGSKDKAKL